MSIILNKLKAIFALAVLLFLAFSADAFANDYSRPEHKVIIENKLSEFNYEIVGKSVFVPLRPVAQFYGATVKWEEGKGATVSHNTEEFYPNVYLSGSTAMVNLWDIKTFLGIKSYYSADYNVVSLNSNNAVLSESQIKRILPKYGSYTAEDLEWLAKIIHAEANGEPYEAKLAVGGVILNRKKSDTYPSTVKKIIFDNKNGVQFTPTANGSIYNTPSAHSFLAALESLEGKHNAKNALFFINPVKAKSSWVSRNREFAFTLENHDFYY